MSFILHAIRNPGGILPLTVGTDAPAGAIAYQGLLINGEGNVYATTAVPPARFFNGLPLDANGRLVVEDAPAAYYNAGMPYTESHALACANSEAAAYFGGGAGFTAAGSMAVSGLAPPAPPTAPTNMVAFESSGAPALRFYRLDTSPYAEVQPIAGYTESSCNAFAYSSELNHFVAERSTGLSVYDTTTWPFTKLQDLAFYASQSNTARAAYSPDGRLLAITLSGNNNQALYSTDGYPAPQLFASGTAGALAFSHDSAFLAIGYNSAPYVRLFDVTSLTATSLPTLPSQPSSYVRALAFHPSVPIVAAAVGSDGVGLWDVGAGTYIGARTFGSLQVQAVALNPAANRMAIGLYSGSGSAALLKVLDCTDFLNPASWTEIAVTDPPAGASWIYDLAWSPGGDILAVKSRAGPAYSLAFDTTAEPYVKVPSFDVVNTDSGDRVGFLNAAAMPPP